MLMLCRVPPDDVTRDYLLTNEELVPARKPVFDRFAAAGGDPALLMPVLGVDRRYLDAGLDEMTGRFGGVEGYFAEGLGIDAAGQASLREAFVERA
jgi:protein-tyrosine phosphatase